MKKDLTQIVFIIDRSGSMASLTDDTIGGFNSFVKSQKEVDGDALITTVLFDHKYEVLHKQRDISGLKAMDNKNILQEVRLPC